MYKKSLGTRGENIAVKYYENLGYKIIQQNYWTVLGEIDLVLEKDKKILLVEVKTRCNDKFGWGEECIGPKKLLNIQQAYYILQQEKNLPEYFEIEICAIELSYKKAKIKRFLI
jgi:putative endonuclease